MRGSRGIKEIEADLKVALPKAQKSVGLQAEIPPGFQEAGCDVLQGADAFGKRVAKQASLGHQLKDEVGNLEQEIEYLIGCLIFAVRMFQLKASVLLHIESFVFNFPS